MKILTENLRMAELGKIFIISGPAGVGKSTVCRHLLNRFSGCLKRITTVTTRAPRPGEIDGIDYCFIDEATFLRYIAEEKFLEYVNVYKKYFYGTPIAPVLSNVRHGIDSLLIIDTQGINNIRQRFHYLALTDCIVTIFIVPENLGVLEERLKMRGSESPEDLARRLEAAKNEIKCAKNYDYIVVSGSPEEDLASLEGIYNLEQRPKISSSSLSYCACEDS
ncbi:MAG: guanylate kinase [Puniceicoccales bacterium]|jgi:guanylate kinase|nr:guanylate kinase [Puniceicoccales bacterium]